MGIPHIPRFLSAPLDPFLSSEPSLEKMASSVSDASLASAIHAGPWWRHRGV
jgi:hypothetical protein